MPPTTTPDMLFHRFIGLQRHHLEKALEDEEVSRDTDRLKDGVLVIQLKKHVLSFVRVPQGLEMYLRRIGSDDDVTRIWSMGEPMPTLWAIRRALREMAHEAPAPQETPPMPPQVWLLTNVRAHTTMGVYRTFQAAGLALAEHIVTTTREVPPLEMYGVEYVITSMPLKG